MRAARGVLETEALDLVALLAEAGGGGGAGQARAHHQHRELALVAGVDQAQVVAMLEPLVGERTARQLRVEVHRTSPLRTATGKEMLPRVMIQAKAWAKPLRQRLKRGWFQPSD